MKKDEAIFSLEVFEIINNVISENRQVLNKEQFARTDRERIKDQINRKIEGKQWEYMHVVYMYLQFAAAMDYSDAKLIFERIFFEDLEKDKVGELFLIPFYTMKFAGLDDLVDIAFLRTVDLNTIASGKVEDIFLELREIYYHAKCDYPLLIIGQTGTSKGLLPKAIHSMGKRRNGPFVEINCAAIPKELVESELFGHVDGAFTGAKFKGGLLAEANGGTMFLNEIGKMDILHQAKLLKVIEDKTYRRIGSSKVENINVRFIAAAQPQEVEDETKFFPDLRSRFNYPDVIEMPPLNDRLTKLPKIINNSLKRVLKQGGMGENLSIQSDAFSLLLNHHYQANYRELEGILRSAARSAYLSARSVILPEDLKRLNTSKGMSKDIPYVELINKLGRDIKLRDIFDFTDEVKKDLIETKVREVVNSGRPIKSVLKADGFSDKQYTNFRNKIKNATGKGIEEIR